MQCINELKAGFSTSGRPKWLTLPNPSLKNDKSHKVIDPSVTTFALAALLSSALAAFVHPVESATFHISRTYMKGV